MPQTPKPVYTVQGHKFTLKETSIEVREEVNAKMAKLHERLISNAVAIQSNMERERLLMLQEVGTLPAGVEIPEEQQIEPTGEYEYWFELFCALTTGPHDKLDVRKFDIKVAEDAKNDFLPAAKRTANELALFSMRVNGGLL